MKKKIDSWEARRKAGFSPLHMCDFPPTEALESTIPGLEVREEFDLATQPLPLQDLPKDCRMQQAMKVIERDYQRIHMAINSLWGHRECGEYLQKLLMSSDDAAGHNRMGFKTEIVTAMFVLSDLHDEQFNQH